MTNYKLYKNSIITAVAISVTGLQVYAADIVETGKCGSTLAECSYSLDSEGNLIISGNGKISGAAFASWSTKGKKVDIKNVVIEKGITEIGAQAFQSQHLLESISIPNTVTIIKSQAFYNNIGLRSIEIPASVKTIEKSAFLYSYNLEDLTIQGKDVNIGDAFFATALTHYKTQNSRIHAKSGSETEKRLKELLKGVAFEAIPKRTSYTIQEANEATHEGNDNTITFSW